MKTLREALTDYLMLRRSLGYKLQEAGRTLPGFITYLESHHADVITEELALAWALDTPKAHATTSRARRLSRVRAFARYRYWSDPRTQIPSPGLLREPRTRATPYIYSTDEILDLLDAALRMEPRYKSGALLPWVYHCLFGLLSVTGMRLGEACNLQIKDCDLDSAILTIRHAKHGKQRLIPIHETTCGVLADYLQRRARHWESRSVSEFLFVSSWGLRLDKAQIHRAFHALSRQIGLRGEADSHGPRLHDFRHRFATTTLINWYRNDLDPGRLLPVLSAFLGHTNIADTQWYLEAIPELMSEAMSRVERRWEDRS